MITPKRNGGLGTSGMLNFCELCKFWLSRQSQAKYSTETWMFWLILKHKLMFLQWILGHLIVLYKLPLSKLEFKSMIFTPFLHFFPTIYHSVYYTISGSICWGEMNVYSTTEMCNEVWKAAFGGLISRAKTHRLNSHQVEN